MVCSNTAFVIEGTGEIINSSSAELVPQLLLTSSLSIYELSV